MKPKTLILATCLIGILGGIFAKMWLDVPSDQSLIAETLRDATRSGKEGQAGGVLEALSTGFKVGDFEPSGGEIADFVKNQKPEVTILTPTPVIRGDLAEVVSSVRIKFGVGNIGASHTVNDVRIVLQKEAGLRYGVFPTPRWRIIKVSAPNSDSIGQ